MAKKKTTPADDIQAVRDEAVKSVQKPQSKINLDNIEEVVRDMKVKTLTDKNALIEFQKENNYTDLDIVAIMTVAASYVPDMPNIVLKKDSEITFGELHDYYEKARVNFIIIHRVNHIVHESMIEVYDLLEKYNKLRFTTKMHHLNAEKAWDKYLAPRQKVTERTAWYTFMDHLRITYDILHPRIDKLYETVRDYMIRMGWRDVELKGKIEVALLMMKMHEYTFKDFFKDFRDACGADFSGCYANDRLTDMGKHFVSMCEVLGIKLQKDEHGLYDIAGFDGEKNQRVKWAWEDFIMDLRDDDLMDEAAKRAIELNPSINEHYQEQLDEVEKKQIDDNVDRLQEKFKVTKRK